MGSEDMRLRRRDLSAPASSVTFPLVYTLLCIAAIFHLSFKNISCRLCSSENLFLGYNLSEGSMNCHFYSVLRSNPFYEPKTSSPVKPQAGGPSLDMGSGQKRRAPPPPSSSPGFGPSPPASKPSSVPDREQALAVGPSPVTAVIGRELASSSPKVTRLHLCNMRKTHPNVRYK